MTEPRSTALTLPDEQTFKRDMALINRFQQIVHQTMIAGQDYGIIPGTQKPTLLKPGAEKIAKLLGLADTYEILDRQEDWQKPFFRFLLKCKLISVRDNVVISEGLGECNSMEGKYRYRWIGERDLPTGIDKSKLVNQERHSKTGGHWFVYRLENEEIYSQVNTLLKMAKKRALVDAALSAGRLSDVFTQDIEDIQDVGKEDKEEAKETSVTPISVPEKQATEGIKPEQQGETPRYAFDPITLREDLKAIKWHLKDFDTAKSWLKQFKIDTAGALEEVVNRLDRDSLIKFLAEIEKRKEVAH